MDKHVKKILEVTESHMLGIGEEAVLERLLDGRGVSSEDISFSILENAIRSEKQIDFSDVERFSRHKLRRHNSLGSAPKYANRRLTFSGIPDVKYAAKKRRRVNSVALPTKFLLGGDITDPLNLKSLADEEVNRRLNAITPISSPVSVSNAQTEIEVLIPPNIYDPLNLNTGENIQFNLMPSRARKRKIRRQHSKHCMDDYANSSEVSFDMRMKPVSSLQSEDYSELQNNLDKIITGDCGKQSVGVVNIIRKNCDDELEKKTVRDLIHNSSDVSETICLTDTETVPAQSVVSVKQPKTCEKDGSKSPSRKPRVQLFDIPETEFKKDKIVSPVVPQGTIFKLRKRSSRFKPGRNRFWKKDLLANVNFKESDEKYACGSYPFQYKCHVNQESRLRFFNKDFFSGKEVLDIGCNVGCVAMNVAEHYGPNKVVAVDICPKAIDKAKKHLQCHLNSCITEKEKFPVSMAASYGALVKVVLPSKESYSFPNNIRFHCANYVPDSEEALQIQQPEFDIILCLRVTKWIHLNYGDEGLKRSFKRIFSQLRCGGHLILEPQPWESYKKCQKLAPKLYVNYRNIQLKPDKFIPYLLSAEVGFRAWKFLGHSPTSVKGSRSPVFLLTKTEDIGLPDEVHHSSAMSPVVFNDIEWSGCPEDEDHQSSSDWEKSVPEDCLEGIPSFQRVVEETNYDFYQDNQMFIESYVFTPENDNSSDI